MLFGQECVLLMADVMTILSNEVTYVTRYEKIDHLL